MKGLDVVRVKGELLCVQDAAVPESVIQAAG
jgi:hypothetical protein